MLPWRVNWWLSRVLVRALSHRGQNAGPQAASQVVCGRHVRAELVQRGGKRLASLSFVMNRPLIESLALLQYDFFFFNVNPDTGPFFIFLCRERFVSSWPRRPSQGNWKLSTGLLPLKLPQSVSVVGTKRLTKPPQMLRPKRCPAGTRLTPLLRWASYF